MTFYSSFGGYRPVYHNGNSVEIRRHLIPDHPRGILLRPTLLPAYVSSDTVPRYRTQSAFILAAHRDAERPCEHPGFWLGRGSHGNKLPDPRRFPETELSALLPAAVADYFGGHGHCAFGLDHDRHHHNAARADRARLHGGRFNECPWV